MRSALVLVVVLVARTATAEPPRLESPFAIALDSTTGAELFARRADDVRPIASMTKIFVAMALRKYALDLDRWTEISPDDARAAAGGAPTQLAVGRQFGNLDLLHAMLLVSDNRVPSALARSAGLGPDELLASMRGIAGDLGLAHTKLVDATGILGNASTAREMALALRETLRDPLLRRIMTTRFHRVVSRDEAVAIDYRSTVTPLWNRRYEIRGGKTGWTEDAGYCVLVAAKVGECNVVIALLGAEHESARSEDFTRLADWLARSPTCATSAIDPRPDPRDSLRALPRPRLGLRESARPRR